MNALIKSSGKTSRSNWGSLPPLNQFFKKGISTQELDATKGDRERVVILGSGWAGFVLSRELSCKKFQTIVVSPRSYFVFTPLLASTAVGTLEFRTTLESVRARRSGVEFIQGWADDVSFNEKRLTIEESISDPKSHSLTGKEGHGEEKKKGKLFDLTYDKLVVAVGCYSQTFNTPGVRENALFLKDVVDARKIRKRLLECFELASLPTTSPELKKSLLNFAVVGGGPTGVEFSAELFDLCHQDLAKLYPNLIPLVKITIYDVASKILPMFDSSLADYALKLFRRDGIKVQTEYNILSLEKGLPGSGEKVEAESDDGGCLTLKTKQEGEVGIGMCVWSTGLMMNPFIASALSSVHTFPTNSAILPPPSTPPSSSSPSPLNPSSKSWSLRRSPKTGGLIVDSHFRLELEPSSSSTISSTPEPKPTATMSDVFALGDVAVLESSPLPATAQVANQEAKFLGRSLNKCSSSNSLDNQPGFQYKNLGVMTYLGDWKAIMQTDSKKGIKGRTAWLIWRGAYLTQTISWRNKVLIPVYWFINWVFGRDISRF